MCQNPNSQGDLLVHWYPAFESWWHVIQKISGIWDVPISGGTTKSNSANLVIGSHQQVMTKKNLLDQLR